MVPQELATSLAPQVTPQIVLRGLIRNWWRILVLWLVVSAPAMCLIWLFIQPTYEAFSLLRVEPSTLNLFAPSNNQDNTTTHLPYLQTQVQLIKSDQVLEMAVSNLKTLSATNVANLPSIKQSSDPKYDLNKDLTVEHVQDAYLIRVALESKIPSEAATIVNTVVDAYKKHTDAYAQSANKRLRDSLETEERSLQKKLDATKDELKFLVQKGNVAVPDTKEKEAIVDKNDDPAQPSFKNLGESLYQKTMGEMLNTDLALIEAESQLLVLEQELKASNGENEEQGSPADAEFTALIEAEFMKDPEVVGLIGEITEERDHLENIKDKVRQSNDPSLIAINKKLHRLTDQYENLWEAKYKEIHQRLRGVSRPSLSAISELRLKVAMLKHKKDRQTENFKQIKLENKAANTDTLLSTLLSHTLTSLQGRLDRVTGHLAQLAFETNQEPFRISVHPAAIPVIPSNNKRLKLMAAAPVGVLFMVFGLFLLLEVKAERVADPDALSTRVQSKVYALPPLPTARAMRKLSAPDAEDQIEQFIQRLDHLRFAVCGTSVELGKGRCVLITSATGGEGKTTLAAHLATRCGDAGMSTILIDADLRRAALCVLLDLPEGPGLSDVLKNEAKVEDVVIPVRGGTFVLLPAGTPVQDTSCVLQSRKVGELIAQLRKVYDLIIIDSPPVLPVPDGLILGRWADGAVLAARYDISRFPQVERARRQLDGAGIPVLGTVINGMRNSESYSGSYAYKRRPPSSTESSDTI
jgi:polysaccharide biosynthesis transport protein